MSEVESVSDLRGFRATLCGTHVSGFRSVVRVGVVAVRVDVIQVMVLRG